MANFATHIGVGTAVSGALATLTLAADVIAPESLVAVTLAGVLGSVLPDIDLKESRPSRAMFSGLAVFLSFCVLFTMAERYSIAEMWIAWAAMFLGVRYGAEAVFHRISYHRGIFHSLIAGLAFAFLTVLVFKHVFGRHEGVAWLAGGFLLIGYLTHLVLDELYSVDVMDRRLKTSFGSALKLVDGRHPGHSVAMTALAVGLFLATPSAHAFVSGISSPTLWHGLQQRLLPRDHWFGVDVERLARGVRPAASSSIETGSVTATAAPAGDTNRAEQPAAESE